MKQNVICNLIFNKEKAQVSSTCAFQAINPLVRIRDQFSLLGVTNLNSKFFKKIDV